MEEDRIYHKILKIIKTSLIVLAVINSLLISLSVIMTINFFLDSAETNLDFLYLTRISLNSFGNICDAVHCNPSSGWILKGVINFLIIAAFWLQYLILNNLNFQGMIQRSLGRELETHIKLICQIFSYFSYIMMLQVYQPASDQELIIIQYIEEYKLYANIISLILKLYSIFLIFTSLPFHLITKDVLNIKLIFLQLQDDSFSNKFVFSKSGIYNYCLSPFRGGLVFFLISYITNLDYSKLLLICFSVLTLNLDLISENTKFRQKSQEYCNHIRNVENYYIVNIKRFSNTKTDYINK
jgi:hypothetical protein